MKAALLAPVVLTGLALSACGWSSTGSVDTAAPSASGSIDGRSQSGMVKGSTSGDSAPLSADQADQRAQDRCLELEGEVLTERPMRKETDPLFMVWKMPGILRLSQCVGERPGGTSCAVNEFNQVAFQRANVNGEAEVLKCSLASGGLFWLRIEAFPASG